MSMKIEQRTVTVPVKIFACNKCKKELREGIDDATGWICCHPMVERPDDVVQAFHQAVTEPDQHLCPACKYLVADTVNASPIPDSALLRRALERIVREVSAGSRTGPDGIRIIATEALAGREAGPSTDERPSAGHVLKTGDINGPLQAFLQQALKTGNVKVIKLDDSPGVVADLINIPPSGDPTK